MTPLDPDRENLRLLVIFHYVWAALQAVGGLFGLAFIAMGVFFASGSHLPQNAPPPPPWFGAIFAGLGAFFTATFEVLAVLTFLTARFLSERRHPVFCIVISVINCFSFPLGTVLGVFTLLNLQRPSVRALFSGPATPSPPPSQP